MNTGCGPASAEDELVSSHPERRVAETPTISYGSETPAMRTSALTVRKDVVAKEQKSGQKTGLQIEGSCPALASV